EGHVVLGEAVSAERGPADQLVELGLLGGEEPDPVGEGPDVAEPADDEAVLDAAAGPQVLVAGGDDAELGQQLLQLAGQTLAVGRVVDGEAVVTGQARAAVALEAGHEEGPLHAPAALPDDPRDV